MLLRFKSLFVCSTPTPMKRGVEDGDEDVKRFELFCQQFSYKPEKSPKTKSTPPEEKESTPNVAADAPFVAPYPNRYREKYSSPCANCFKNWFY